MLVTGLKMPEAYDGKCNNRNKKLEECFSSDKYRQIMHERIDSVDARALIVEE